MTPAVVGQALHPAVLDGVRVEELQLELVVVEALPFGNRQRSKVFLGRRVSGRNGNVRLVTWSDEETVSGNNGELILAFDCRCHTQKVLSN